MTLTINKKTRSQQPAFGWARVASVALTYPLSILFAMAAGTKVMKYATYRSYLHASGLMGDGAAWWLSFMLPALELTVAALLVWPRTRRAGLLTAIALLPCYHYYIYYALNEAPFTPCGCLGALPITWGAHYTLNLIVLLMALAALAFDYTARKREPTRDKRGSP